MDISVSLTPGASSTVEEELTLSMREQVLTRESTLGIGLCEGISTGAVWGELVSFSEQAPAAAMKRIETERQK